jgi:hypothetical protein
MSSDAMTFSGMRGAGFAGPLHCPPVGGAAEGRTGGVHP